VLFVALATAGVGVVRGGFVGVGVFLLPCGFLITGLLLAERGLTEVLSTAHTRGAVTSREGLWWGGFDCGFR
jgi:peptidoglycan/LPS O-acetylase OafA/YrhL